MRRSRLSAASVLALALTLTPALAASHKPKFDGGGPGNGNAAAQAQTGAHGVGAGGCPPGLAKKDPECIPPGQARKYEIGESVPRTVDLDRYFDDLDLPRLDDLGYLRTGDYVYRVDPETRAILDAIAIAEVLLN